MYNLLKNLVGATGFEPATTRPPEKDSLAINVYKSICLRKILIANISNIHSKTFNYGDVTSQIRHTVKAICMGIVNRWVLKFKTHLCNVDDLVKERGVV